MQRISLAPVLSATRSRVSCWIIYLLLSSGGFCSALLAGSLAERIVAVMHTSRRGLLAGTPPPVGNWGWCCLLGLLEDLDQTPPLGGGQRPRLHDQHEVAHARRALLVVRLDLAGASDDLAVERVLDPVLDLDHDGLVHLVAHDIAPARLAVRAVLGRGGGVLLSHVSLTRSRSERYGCRAHARAGSCRSERCRDARP